MKKIIDKNGNCFLWEKGDLHTSLGTIKEDELKKSSGKVKTHLGKEFIIFDGGFVDKLNKIKRGPAIMIKKDIGMILANTGINEKSKIVEAGTGCGYLTSFLGRISKNVVSYEKNKEFFEIAKKNLNYLDVKVKLKNKDIYEGISEKNLDLIVLDLLEPWKIIEHAKKSLKSGGFFVCFVTNVSQLIQTVRFLNGFYLEKVIENIEREWEVKDLVIRPKNIIIGHTGFLIFARKC